MIHAERSRNVCGRACAAIYGRYRVTERCVIIREMLACQSMRLADF